MGFAIQFVDMPVDLNQTDGQQEKLNIDIFCKKSGLRATLSRPHTVCSCPNADKASDGKSLVPSTPDATAQVVKEVIFNLFSMLTETKDINQNINNEGAAAIETKDSKSTLTRQSTWEVDPKTSPPLSTSSPLPEANSDQETAIADMLQEARDKIDKALSLLPSKNNTFTKTKYVKRVSNIRVSPTITTPTRSTTGVSTPDVPLKKTPVKSATLLHQTPKKLASGIAERRQLLVPSKVKFLSKKGTVTPTNDSLKINKKDTPWPATKASSAFASPKLTKTTSLRGSNTNLSATGANTNSTKPKSAIPSFGFKKTTPSSFKKA